MTTAANARPESVRFWNAVLRVFDMSLGQMLWSRRTVFMALATVWISNFGRSFMKPYSFDVPSLYEQECAGNAGRENNDRPH